MSKPPGLSEERGSSTDEPEVSDRTLAIALRKRLHEVSAISLCCFAIGERDVYVSARCVASDGNIVEVKHVGEGLDQAFLHLLGGIDKAVHSKPRTRKGSDER